MPYVPTRKKYQRLVEAYKMMAELKYRPSAPGDGLGSITVPYQELDLDQEAHDYVMRFVAEEDRGSYACGSTDFSFCRAAILALEAFRIMNSGWLVAYEDPGAPETISPSGAALVPNLLRRAADEYEQVIRDHQSKQ